MLSAVAAVVCALRLGGWVPPLIWLLYRFPLRGACGVLFYYLILSRLPAWKALAHRFATAGMDPRFHLIKHVEIDLVNKRYLFCVHPHVSQDDGRAAAGGRLRSVRMQPGRCSLASRAVGCCCCVCAAGRVLRWRALFHDLSKEAI